MHSFIKQLLIFVQKYDALALYFHYSLKVLICIYIFWKKKKIDNWLYCLTVTELKFLISERITLFSEVSAWFFFLQCRNLSSLIDVWFLFYKCLLLKSLHCRLSVNCVHWLWSSCPYFQSPEWLWYWTNFLFCIF